MKPQAPSQTEMADAPRPQDPLRQERYLLQAQLLTTDSIKEF
jgi:hypothetical protein